MLLKPFFLFLAFASFAVIALDVEPPEKLDCNSMTVPFRPTTWVRFARPMEEGDVITIEGVFPYAFGTSTFSFNLLPAMAFDHDSLHMRFDTNKLIFSSSEIKWNPDEVKMPQRYAPGTHYKFNVQKLYDAWQITDALSGTLLQIFKFRHSPSRPINYFMGLETVDSVAYGLQVTVSMKCIRPPVRPPPPTPPPRPTPPPGHNHGSSSDSSDDSDNHHHHGGGHHHHGGGGNNGGHHHHHHHHGGSSSNSNSGDSGSYDSEDCDD